MDVRVAIGLGSSLGDRRGRLEDAVRRLNRPPLRLEAVSGWVRTPPMRGGRARNWFLNGVALYTTDEGTDPHGLLDLLVALEVANGRRRAHYWGDRPLDLDLLLVEGCRLQQPELVLPHPGIGLRRFVLEPLLSVWPDATNASGRRYSDLPTPPGPKPVLLGRLARTRPLRYL